jgi:Uma2 family endonuclease
MQTTHNLATLKDLEALPEGSRTQLINDRLVALPRPTGAHIKTTNELFYELNGPFSRKKDGPALRRGGFGRQASEQGIMPSEAALCLAANSVATQVQRWIFVIEPQLYLVGQSGRQHSLIPDIAGWRRERMPEVPKTHRFEETPDWICEVIPDGNAGEITNERLSEASCEARPRLVRSLSWSACLANESSRVSDRQEKPPIYLSCGVGFYWLIDPETRELEVWESANSAWKVFGVFSHEDKVKAAPFEAVELDLSVLWIPRQT